MLCTCRCCQMVPHSIQLQRSVRESRTLREHEKGLPCSYARRIGNRVKWLRLTGLPRGRSGARRPGTCGARTCWRCSSLRGCARHSRWRTRRSFLAPFQAPAPAQPLQRCHPPESIPADQWAPAPMHTSSGDLSMFVIADGTLRSPPGRLSGSPAAAIVLLRAS